MCKKCWSGLMTKNNWNATQYVFDYISRYSTAWILDISGIPNWIKEQIDTEEFPPNVNIDNLIEGLAWWVKGKDATIIKAYLNQNNLINWPFKDISNKSSLKVAKV